jgi:uncharacterized protein YbaP (TraB family)
MRTILIAAAVLFLSFPSNAQVSKIKSNKYPSLLWEITGKGMKKPSYLFGTMHVSNKMVFHLSDSFYLGIKNADVVALETNPESWQEDMSKYDMEGSYMRRGGGGAPEDYLTVNTLKFYPYEKLIELALHSNPAIINSFLYRSYDFESDFEEDTYLDLYIFQVGRKWGKKLCGVENFDESMQLMKEAYVDASKEKNPKRRSYEYDEDFSANKMQDAYRTGNLDLLDTINQLNSYSAAFDEKFLYRRNQIQADNIDSIIKSGSSLFVGVGAAHLPGHRGVIEMLRAKGYSLRPIKMMDRDSRHKEEVDKIRVPVVLNKQTSADGFYTVSMPGKLYSFMPSLGMLEQQQYADMANGSYYMITRIQTNALLWGHSSDVVTRKVDSVLYENIPGRILTKNPITKNGYKGFDITNRTRRGDFQHYNIFITPFEVLLFKMSGNGDYVKDGNEAAQFFNSIELKDYKKEWKKYSPVAGGFEVELPHQPIQTKGSQWQFTSYDKETGTLYEVIRTDIHNYNFVEEDSFDLNLMEESFSGSEFIDKILSRKQTKYQGYPALDARYRLKDGGQATVRYLIKGPHYYTLISRGKKESPQSSKFFQSFSITPFVYGKPFQQKDTALFYSVQSPVPLVNQSKISMEPEPIALYGRDDEERIEYMVNEERVVANDTTGEKLYVSFSKYPKYFYENDSVQFGDIDKYLKLWKDWTVRSHSLKELPGKTKVWDYTLGNPLSSRTIRVKSFNRQGATFTVMSLGDTLSQPSAFVKSFYDTFQPFDTVKGTDPTTRKTQEFFKDFFSKDTVEQKKAARNVSMVEMDSTDLPQIKRALQSLSWKQKKYLDIKKDFISKLGDIPAKASSDLLKELYYAAGDTIELQYRAMEALLEQKTNYSYQTFKDILLNEPPVLNVGSGTSSVYSPVTVNVNQVRQMDMMDEMVESYESSNGSFFDELYDSTQLTATIIRDILPLIHIEDYERPLMYLLANMVDSGQVMAKDYESYMPKFLIEAKQSLKKQQIAEKNRLIEKAQQDGEEENYNIYSRRSAEDYGNSMLSLYARLLLPFWDRNPAIPQLMDQLLRSNDKRLKYNTAMLLLQHKKALPDTMLKYFAGLDEFRYELYNDLSKAKLASRFPASYNNHTDLARSMLMNEVSYDTPDSIVFLERLPAQHKGKSGFVYFFKYKLKKEDNNWKIASAGLIPSDPKKFEFDGIAQNDDEFDFTAMTVTRLTTDQPVKEQLQKELKKLLYSKRKSAEQFYKVENDDVLTSLFRGR